ncbi:MAG: pyridoxal phosphate-dependent aminotransferase [Bacteroidales bacterium]|nr:pyridoxal phosphate-dependent aminotransferase [Bacteroidales bacterium]
MNFDFDTVIPRRGSDSVKWDLRPDVLPMWVADMDFRAAPCIIEALQRKVDHGVFGYTHIPDSFYAAVRGWFSDRHGWAIGPQAIIPISGLVPAASIALEALGCRGGKVVMHTPAYNCFFSNIRNTGGILADSPLVQDRATRKFRIDFDAFEQTCSDPEVKAFLLCNPHNPTGRLWSREELERLGDICLRHGIPVISDEIHCEITAPGTSYTPFASIKAEFAQNCISLVSPSKSFNIAGLQAACMVCERPDWRERIDRVINDWEHCDLNPLGVAALQAAYTPEGAEWLEGMRRRVFDNFQILKDRFERELPQCPVTELEATYLAWIDCSALSLSGKQIEEELITHEKVWINGGGIYGDDRFIRINIACPEATLQDGLDRILKGLNRIQQKQ